MNILVTGSSRGIGRAIALALGKAGHSVGVHYNTRRGPAEEVLSSLHTMGVRADLFQADLSDPGQCRDLVDRAAGSFGRLDGLINNAGVTRDRSLFNMSDAEWRDVLDVNLSAPFYCLQAAAKRMRDEKDGFIINIASLLGLRGAVGCANYVAAKAGLIGLTKAAAKELGRFNIRVNAVLPGFHLTEMSEKMPPEARNKTIAAHLLGRSTDIEELAGQVARLAELKTVSGQIFNFDSRII